MAEASSFTLPRIAVGADGRTVIDEVAIPLSPWSRGGVTGLASELMRGQGLQLRHLQADAGEWHAPATRQLVVVLEGEGIIEAEDGALLHLRPGLMFLMDHAGSGGHKNQSLGPAGLVAAFMPLDP
jgi:hypothetical protein